VTVGKEVWPNGVPEVGQIAKRSRQATSRDIELFTEISGDRNPLHYDLQEITMDSVKTALENF
jgi:acyl dehydratase